MEAVDLDNLDITDDLGKGSPISEAKQKPDDYELRKSRERETGLHFQENESENGYIFTLLQSTRLGFRITYRLN